MSKYLIFAMAMSFCTCVYAQSTPKMQLSELDFVQFSIEDLGEIDVCPDKQFATSVAQLDSKRIAQHTNQSSFFKDLFYGNESEYKGNLAIADNWKTLVFRVDSVQINANEAEKVLSNLFDEKKIQSIYVARLHYQKEPINVKGYVFVTTKPK